MHPVLFSRFLKKLTSTCGQKKLPETEAAFKEVITKKISVYPGIVIPYYTFINAVNFIVIIFR
jgi:hypothetical protein